MSSQITMYYDPMIAKLIAWGANREEALFKLEHALSHYFIGGLKTNIPFLQTICHHPKFRKAELSTDFLSNEKINLPVADKQMGLLMAVSVDYLKNTNAIQDPLLQEAFAWQSQISSHWIWRYKDKEDVIEAFITPINKNQFKVRINNLEHLISGHLHGNQLRIETNKQTYHATIEKKKQFLTLYTNQWQITIERFDWGTIGVQATTHKGQLTAPMPATVVAVLKNIGEKVKAGERLIVLEAMKMEHTIHAPADGILLEIFYAVGAQVNEGEELLSLSEEDS